MENDNAGIFHFSKDNCRGGRGAGQLFFIFLITKQKLMAWLEARENVRAEKNNFLGIRISNLEGNTSDTGTSVWVSCSAHSPGFCSGVPSHRCSGMNSLVLAWRRASLYGCSFVSLKTWHKQNWEVDFC